MKQIGPGRVIPNLVFERRSVWPVVLRGLWSLIVNQGLPFGAGFALAWLMGR